MAKQGKSETLSKAVREQLREDILGGEWAPGEKLQLASLSERYETSSTVIREALTQLTGARLIELKPNRGFFIPTLSLNELRDFNELRCLSEEFGIKLAIERGDLQWESEVFAAHHKLERTPRLIDDEPGTLAPEWITAHREFHVQLISACNLPVLIDLSAILFDSTTMYRRWVNQAPAIAARRIDDEHKEILQAVLDRDSARAGELLRQHYTASMELILEVGLSVSGLNNSKQS
ncbi:MAG: GntR family transcriptional regulator [Gulosibacter sp.]|uniref:GntR family transcriptional regulator n=1 Tax=Gulosibacter sp. TaxID=2817531 RepID=UPI003F8E1B9B